MKDINVILASSSPRRSEILTMLGIPFRIITPDTEEKSEKKDAGELTKELSYQKYKAVYEKHNEENTLIIACDTVVECDGDILGKPKNDEDAVKMLGELSGKIHNVYSGLTLGLNGRCFSEYACTEVKFFDLTEEKIRGYVKTCEPRGKAGAYAIQGTGSVLVEKINGEYYNVMGLPVALLGEMLEKHFGIGIFGLRKE